MDAGSTKRKDSGGTRQDVPDGADPFLEDGGKPAGRVFAHSSNTLYRYDPLVNTIVKIGKFSCLPQGAGALGSKDNDAVIDIALDRTGQMYATTYWRFLKVDADTANCTIVRTASQTNQYPNSLSFVPIGTVDATEEALVGYAFDNLMDATIYTRIDLVTGVMSDLDDLNPATSLDGNEYGISGDFVSLARDQGRTLATVNVVKGNVGAGHDFLAEVDPKTGTLKRIIGDTGQNGFYGVGFWAGKVYGFTTAGTIYEIDTATGASHVVLEAKDEGDPIAFFGAGMTTDSPTAP